MQLVEVRARERKSTARALCIESSASGLQYAHVAASSRCSHTAATEAWHACATTLPCRGGEGGMRERDGAGAPRSAPHGDFGDFERHTTGFGSRMLMKMGFAGAGSGLGAANQGRAEPVLPSMRGKGVGLGAD